MIAPAIAAAVAFVACALLGSRFSLLACCGMAFAAWLAGGNRWLSRPAAPRVWHGEYREQMEADPALRSTACR